MEIESTHDDTDHEAFSLGLNEAAQYCAGHRDALGAISEDERLFLAGVTVGVTVGATSDLDDAAFEKTLSQLVIIARNFRACLTPGKGH